MRTGELRKHPDGRYKRHMKIPLAIPPSPQYPEGIGVWYVKGNDQTELVRAMTMAGCDVDPDTSSLYPPRAGDVIHVKFTHERAGRAGSGMNPTKIKQVSYSKGNGQPPQMAPPMVQGQVVGSQYQPQPQYQQPIQPQPQYQQPIQPQPQFQQPQNGYAQQPDPAQAYQQATGQPMQPYAGNGQYAASPQVQMAQPAPAQQPQYPQQFPTPAPPAPGAPPSGPVPPSAAPSPSNGQPTAPDGSAWPADVPFIAGLTPAQAQMAAAMHLNQQAPQQ
jgi:hypothetical protein